MADDEGIQSRQETVTSELDKLAESSGMSIEKILGLIQQVLGTLNENNEIPNTSLVQKMLSNSLLELRIRGIIESARNEISSPYPFREGIVKIVDESGNEVAEEHFSLDESDINMSNILGWIQNTKTYKEWKNEMYDKDKRIAELEKQLAQTESNLTDRENDLSEVFGVRMITKDEFNQSLKEGLEEIEKLNEYLDEGHSLFPSKKKMNKFIL